MKMSRQQPGCTCVKCPQRYIYRVRCEGSSQSAVSALCFTPDIMTLLATIIIFIIVTCSSHLTVSAEEEAGVGAGVEGRFFFGNPMLGMR